MVTQSTAIKIARKYVQAVRDTGVSVRQAYLFGSFAKNMQHKWSDIDIAIVADDFTGIAAIDKDSFRHLHLLPQFMAIEVHTFPTGRWLEGDPFAKEILKNAIQLPLKKIAVEA
jgi:predicted nucleotidyltransferase